MAGLKEIKRRLKSVQNTRKITYAMKLVSAAKLRKAQEAVVKSRDYSNAINVILSELSAELGSGDAAHPLMQVRDSVKNVLLIVVGASRGLCGGYNVNITRKIEAFYKEKSAAGINVDALLIGRKPGEYFRKINRPYSKSLETLSEDATVWPIDDLCREIEQAYSDAKYDQVHIIYTKFKSAISMTVISEQLLPLTSTENNATVSAGSGGNILFKPSANRFGAADDIQKLGRNSALPNFISQQLQLLTQLC